MKKILIITLAFLLVFSLSACNAKEKVAEKVVEDIINSDSDSDVDVDFDGDQMTISDDEGNSMTMGGTEWPSGDAAKLIPECKTGDVVYVLEMTGTVNISMENITEDEYNAYLQSIKNAGFTDETTVMNLYYQVTDFLCITAQIPRGTVLL